MKPAQYCCCLACVLVTLVCLVLPIMGAQGLFESFRMPYSGKVHAEMLAIQLVPPVLLLLIEGLLVYCTVYQKKIPLWVALIGLIGAYGMARGAGDVSHDFSHVVFKECSDIYGNVVSGLSASTAVLLACVWVLNVRGFRGSGYKRRVMTKKARLVIGMVVLLPCWLVLFYFIGSILG